MEWLKSLDTDFLANNVSVIENTASVNANTERLTELITKVENHFGTAARLDYDN